MGLDGNEKTRWKKQQNWKEIIFLLEVRRVEIYTDTALSTNKKKYLAGKGMHTVSNALFRDGETHSATQGSERITHFSKV